MSTLLPPSTSRTERNLAMAGANAQQLPIPFSTLWSPWTCPAHLLPYLAASWSVDRWDDSWPEATKRQVIANSYFVHSRKGTIGAIRRVVEPLGYLIRVLEWWQETPAATRGTFKLDIGVLDTGITEAMYQELERLIADAKPMTRHLTGWPSAWRPAASSIWGRLLPGRRAHHLPLQPGGHRDQRPAVARRHPAHHRHHDHSTATDRRCRLSAIYFAIPTNAGQAKIANAIALGVPLKITHMAVGDGNGQPVTPNPARTALVREQRRAPLNTLFQDPLNPAQLVAEQIIPEAVGGWWIREVGLFDDSGTLIAIANSPDTYKPQLSEGSGRTQTIRMVLIVSDTSAVELKIDPSVVLATRKYVDDVMKAHKESRDHPAGTRRRKGC